MSAEGRVITIVDLACIALVALVAHNVFQSPMTLANKYESRTSYVNMLLGTQTVLAFIVDFVVFDSEVKIFNIVGAATVMISSIMIVVSKEQPFVIRDVELNRAEKRK